MTATLYMQDTSGEAKNKQLLAVDAPKDGTGAIAAGSLPPCVQPNSVTAVPVNLVTTATTITEGQDVILEVSAVDAATGDHFFKIPKAGRVVDFQWIPTLGDVLNTVQLLNATNAGAISNAIAQTAVAFQIGRISSIDPTFGVFTADNQIAKLTITRGGGTSAGRGLIRMVHS